MIWPDYYDTRGTNSDSLECHVRSMSSNHKYPNLPSSQPFMRIWNWQRLITCTYIGCNAIIAKIRTNWVHQCSVGNHKYIAMQEWNYQSFSFLFVKATCFLYTFTNTFTLFLHYATVVHVTVTKQVNVGLASIRNCSSNRIIITQTVMASLTSI